MSAVTAFAAVDSDAALAIFDVDNAAAVGRDACSVLISGGDSTGHLQVADDDGMIVVLRLDINEWSGVVTRSGEVHGERVPSPVEDAREFVIQAARHAGDGIFGSADVRIQLYRLAVEIALVVFGENVAENAPALGGVDGVFGARIVDGEMSWIGGPYCL